MAKMFEQLAAHFLDAIDDIKERRLHYVERLRNDTRHTLARFVNRASDIVKDEVKHLLEPPIDDLERRKREFERWNEIPTTVRLCNDEFHSALRVYHCTKPVGHQNAKPGTIDLHTDGAISWS